MKPIILLGIVALAAIGLGMGSLTNVIELTVQQFGVGDRTIDSPVDSANVKFDIQKVLADGGFFKNYIKNCYVSSPEQIPADSRIFCKLTGSTGDVIAEGNILLLNTLKTNTPITVPIDDPNVINSQVQNVHDVLIVIQGPSKLP